MSLRRAIVVSMSILAVLALGAAASLIALADYLSTTTLILNSNLESVRAAQQVQIDLLVYSHARSPVTRAALGSDMFRGLRTVRQYIADEEQRVAVAVAEKEVGQYVEAAQAVDPTAGDATLRLDTALRALRRVSDLNIAQARTAEAQTTRWHRLGDRLGLAIALIVGLGVPLTLAWVSEFAFRPMFGILDAMKAFASGDLNARAPTRSGIDELQTIGMHLNEMTIALKRQHDNQLSFLASVSHDLRSPLNALTLSAAMLSEEGPVPSSEQMRKLAHIIRRQIQFLSRMVDDLHDAQQIEAGELTLREELCDVYALLDDVYELFRETSADHHLILNAPTEPVLLKCDPVRLRQVLNNLVSNAIKYSPRGGQVYLALRRAGEHVVVEVSDSGLGIPREELPYIFEPFRRTRLSRQQTPGTGLGLHVSQRIIKAHGGSIEVDSEIGRGSTFRIRLPAPRT